MVSFVVGSGHHAFYSCSLCSGVAQTGKVDSVGLSYILLQACFLLGEV